MDELITAAHRSRHVKLDTHLQELVADFIAETDHLPSQTTVADLVDWSERQREHPTDNGFTPLDEFPTDPVLSEHLSELRDIVREIGAVDQLVVENAGLVKVLYEDRRGNLHEHTLRNAGTVFVAKWTTVTE